MEKRISTGHRDCCGDMILRKDTVYTKDGEARVIWACGRWWLYFDEGGKKALNEYSAKDIRRRDNALDHSCDNGNIVVTMAYDNTVLSQTLSQASELCKLVGNSPFVKNV